MCHPDRDRDDPQLPDRVSSGHSDRHGQEECPPEDLRFSGRHCSHRGTATALCVRLYVTLIGWRTTAENS